MFEIRKPNLVTRKYTAQHRPWLTILACLLLPNIIRLICSPHIARPVPSDQPISSAITDLVSRHQNLSLCINTRAPGTYLGTSKFKVMKLGTRHAATISVLMLFVCGDVQLNPGTVPTHVMLQYTNVDFVNCMLTGPTQQFAVARVLIGSIKRV